MLILEWKFIVSIKGILDKDSPAVVFEEQDGPPNLRADLGKQRGRNLNHIQPSLSILSEDRIDNHMFDLGSFSLCLLRWDSNHHELTKEFA